MRYIKNLIKKELDPHLDNLNKSTQAFMKLINDDNKAWRQSYQERQNDLTNRLQDFMHTCKTDSTSSGESQVDALKEIANAVRNLRGI